MNVRTFAGLCVAVVVAVVCVVYAPTNFGGRTSYVTTYGTSMIPRFHAGDLAVVQPAKTYHVGEIVAYRSATLRGQTVLHRIAAIDAGHFTFKGDNNSFRDPDHPTADQIIGRLRLRIPHGGAIRSFVGRPVVLFPVLALVIGGMGAGLFGEKRRRDRRRTRTPVSVGRAPGGGRLRVVVPIVAAVTFAGLVLAAVAVWHVPTRETISRRENFGQSLAVGYSGVARAGAAYPDGRVRTGDPVFTRLVQTVDVGFTYEFHADAPVKDVHGTYEVVAGISSGTGWSRSIVLSPARSFAGSRLRGAVVLRPAMLRDLEARFSAETGFETTQVSVTIAPRVHVDASVAGTRVSTDVDAPLGFQLGPIEMTPTSSGASADAPIVRTGSVTVASTAPGVLVLWKLRVPAGWARVALLVALAAILAAAAALVSAHRRRTALGEVDAILRRYRPYLVAVGAVPPTDAATVVSVESIEVLGRLARLHEQVIVHAAAPDGVHRFVLSTDAVVYAYETAESGHGEGRRTIAA